MAQVIKRENITITTGEYQKDGQTKKRYRTIGELVTYQNDDGTTTQFGEMRGPTGSTKFNVYEQQDRNATQPAQQQPRQGYQQATETPQGYHNTAPQQQQPPQYNQNNNGHR